MSGKPVTPAEITALAYVVAKLAEAEIQPKTYERMFDGQTGVGVPYIELNIGDMLHVARMFKVEPSVAYRHGRVDFRLNLHVGDGTVRVDAYMDMPDAHPFPF